MSGKFLARASALSLAVILAACGGDDDSTPLVDVDKEQDESTTPNGDNSDPGGPDTGTTPPNGGDTDDQTDPGAGEAASYRIGLLQDFGNPTSGFVEGEISSQPSVTIEGSTILRVAVLEADEDKFVLEDQSSVTFFSACASSGWSSFQEPGDTVPINSGIAGTVYTPTNQCIGDDVVYARINDDFTNIAKLTIDNDDAPSPPSYRLGSFNSSGDFVDEKIRTNSTNLTVGLGEQPTTQLRIALVENTSEKLVKNSGYNVKFNSMCLEAGLAEIEAASTINNGKLIATYTASPNCQVTDTVTAFVGSNNQLQAEIDLFISENKLALGSYDSETFVPNLSISKEVLDYETSDNPETEIQSVIAEVDENNNFIKQVSGFQSSIEFYSTCIDSGLASVQTTGSTQSGELISTYVAQGCVGTDLLYGRITGTNEVASVPVKISPKVEQTLLLGHFDADTFTDGEIGKSRTSDLPVGAQTRLYFSLVDEEDTLTPLTGQPLSVELSSTCEGVHESDSPFAATNLSLSNGYAEVLYTAQACGTVEKDIVKATLTGADDLSAKAQTSITLDKNGVAHSLTASQPEPNSIASGDYDGTYEGRTSTSFIQFQLKNKDGNGTNLDNKTISFRLDEPAVSGITLTPMAAQTDVDGFVTVTVKAKNGAPNSVFRVIATHEGLETYSAPIAVNSKLPFAERFSLSTSNFAPDTQPGKNGVQVGLTVQAADVNGNRLRGNTIVNFETDQGSIDPECVLDDNGRCTVTWESLNVDETFATIKAYTHGRLADASGQPAGTGEIQAFTNMLMSSSDNVQVLMERTSPAGGNIDPESNTYCATTWVNLPNENSRFSPPTGTEILFSLTEGEFINNASSNNSIPSSSSLLARPGYTACTKVRPTETVEEIEIPNGSGGVTIIEQTTLDIELSVTVTPPADAPLPATDYIKETYQF